MRVGASRCNKTYCISSLHAYTHILSKNLPKPNGFETIQYQHLKYKKPVTRYALMGYTTYK